MKTASVLLLAAFLQADKPPSDEELKALKLQYQVGLCNVTVEQQSREIDRLKKELDDLKKTTKDK